MSNRYKNGLDLVAAGRCETKAWGRVGLVCNQASLTEDLKPSWWVLAQVLGKQLTTLFGPQHGFESTVQENMIESGHSLHLETGLPVYSLYSETREPTARMLEKVDTLVVDLPVTGCRIYTYKYTMAACLRAARKHNKKVVVLDRANPIGGVYVEGPVLEPAARSFVGEFALPTRHGLTMAEAAQYFNQEIGAQLEIVALEDWNPELVWSDYKRPWVLTSPNIPTFDSCVVFPGFVHFEGCNVSEGRGTTLPFQLLGASFVKKGSDIVNLTEKYLVSRKGFVLRPASFMPVIHKDKEKECQGVHVIVTDPRGVQSLQLGMALLRAFWELSQDGACSTSVGAFKWREPPYEYEHKNLPIEIIYGRLGCVEWLESTGFNLKGGHLHLGHESYLETIKSSLLYSRKMRSL